MKPIAITSCTSISSLGGTSQEVASSYAEARSAHAVREVSGKACATYPLSSSAEKMLQSWLAASNLIDPGHDRVTQLALFAAHHAAQSSGWSQADLQNCLVSVGTARGATETIEKTVLDFAEKGRLKGRTSPRTTLGAIASSVAESLGSTGISLGTSMTCASCMQSILTACALIESGRITHALVCGAEAPLTPYTIAQMQALRIYSELLEDYPARPFGTSEAAPNAMALGEGSCALTLEDADAARINRRTIAGRIVGIGFCRENNATPTGMEADGAGLKKSMTAALQDAGLHTVDAIVTHAPGTKVGDRSELEAIQALFPVLPQIFSTKHLTGHTFGASAALSIELGLLLLQGNPIRPFPYQTGLPQTDNKPVSTVMINAAGFGGVITSLVINRDVTL